MCQPRSRVQAQPIQPRRAASNRHPAFVHEIAVDERVVDGRGSPTSSSSRDWFHPRSAVHGHSGTAHIARPVIAAVRDPTAPTPNTRSGAVLQTQSVTSTACVLRREPRCSGFRAGSLCRAVAGAAAQLFVGVDPAEAEPVVVDPAPQRWLVRLSRRWGSVGGWSWSAARFERASP